MAPEQIGDNGYEKPEPQNEEKDRDYVYQEISVGKSFSQEEHGNSPLNFPIESFSRFSSNIAFTLQGAQLAVRPVEKARLSLVCHSTLFCPARPKCAGGQACSVP
jgi:hypothetical protein